MFDIKETHEDPFTVLAITGRLDAVAAPEIEQRLLSVMQEGGRLFILDLGGLDFVASAGLRVFLAFAKMVKKQDGQLTFCCLQPDVLNVFEMTGFTSIFTVHPTREAALQSLAP